MNAVLTMARVDGRVPQRARGDRRVIVIVGVSLGMGQREKFEVRLPRFSIVRSQDIGRRVLPHSTRFTMHNEGDWTQHDTCHSCTMTAMAVQYC